MWVGLREGVKYCYVGGAEGVGLREGVKYCYVGGAEGVGLREGVGGGEVLLY